MATHRCLRWLFARFASIEINPAKFAVRIWYEADAPDELAASRTCRLIGLPLVDPRHSASSPRFVLSILHALRAAINPGLGWAVARRNMGNLVQLLKDSQTHSRT
jgi:hypothetical protein